MKRTPIVATKSEYAPRESVDPQTYQEYLGMSAAIYEWANWARPSQVMPDGDWHIWLIKAGRGWGKTRTGAEAIRKLQIQGYGRFHLVGRTSADVRDTMIEGPSGLLTISPPDNRPVWKPSNRKLVWPNGATATTFSAEEPDSLRGPQCEAYWADELASWAYPEAWDQLQFGARLSGKVRGIVTTTPRPTQLIKTLLQREDVYVTNGSTFENAANLSPSALEALKAQYMGTRLGRQELEGHLLDDNPGALWKRDTLDRLRVNKLPDGVELRKILVGVDPSTTSTGDECGIVTVGYGSDDLLYVLGDSSIQGAPIVWARAVVRAYYEHKADEVVYEANQGGEMVAQTLNTVDALPLRRVYASRNKRARAEPISMLYEQGKVRHVGNFWLLEDELCEWEPASSASPNRLDALVWALTWARNQYQTRTKAKVYK